LKVICRIKVNNGLSVEETVKLREFAEGKEHLLLAIESAFSPPVENMFDNLSNSILSKRYTIINGRMVEI